MTSTHDAASAAIVQHLLELGKRLRKRTAGKPSLAEVDVRTALEKDLGELLKGISVDDYINPLLGISGLNIHKAYNPSWNCEVLLGSSSIYFGPISFAWNPPSSSGFPCEGRVRRCNTCC